MHADKIRAKKTPFLIKPEFDFSILFLKFTKRSPHHKPSKDTPKIRD
jgi:hypothetical protein